MIEFHQDGSAVIALSGEIDLRAVADIDGDVFAALAADPTTVVLRMDRVTFIDSTGLGAMVRSRQTCIARGIPLVVAEPSYQVMRVLRLTGLDSVFAPDGMEAGAPAVGPIEAQR